MLSETCKQQVMTSTDQEVVKDAVMALPDYASRLSDYRNKGVCGLPETIESSRSLKVKLNKLHELMINSKHIVFFTGAGISTAAGIPDFRGPQGVWTLEEMKKKTPKRNNGINRKVKKSNATEKKNTSFSPPLQKNIDHSNSSSSHANSNENNGNKEGDDDFILDQNKAKRCRTQTNLCGRPTQPPRMTFETAQPTYTHLAVTKLINHGIAHFCVTQNVDGLHRRSGLDRGKLAILHGCVFTEKCETCRREYFRNFDVGTISFQPTGRACTVCRQDSGGGLLRDTLLDWEDELPEEDFQLATQQCSMENCLVLCLGTSLRIEPAASLPPLAPNGYVVVNLQVTPKDIGAKLVIHAKVDDVMKDIMKRFGLPED